MTKRKLKFSIWLLLQVLIQTLIFSSCKKESTLAPEPLPPETSRAIHVYDAETQLPLYGVEIIWLRNQSTAEIGYTDSSGAHTFAIGYGDQFLESTFTLNGYLREQFFYALPTLVYLQKPGYIRFHLRNDLPSSSGDAFYVNSPISSNGFLQTHCNGASVDTSFITAADPRGHTITWNLNSAATNVPLNLSSGDTVSVDIFY